MNKDFLSEYHQKEFEQIGEYLKKIETGSADLTYPPKNRFPKLKEPVALSSVAKGPFWPLIPLFGSLIIPIHPLSEKDFFRSHELTKKGFEELIDFCRETGKVQFVLNGDTKDYINLDYLAPIFEEIKPPYIHRKPLSHVMSKENYKKYKIEFETLCQIRSRKGPNMHELFSNIVDASKISFNYEEIIDENFMYYAYFKECGYDYFINNFENLILEDSFAAFSFFAEYGTLIADNSLLSLFKHDAVFSSDELNYSLYGTPKLYEVGKFLLKKLTFMPESFDACKDVISRYEQQDLYRVLESLQEAIKNSNADSIREKNIELNTILDNTWHDEQIARRIKGLKYGIPISTALIGSAAVGPIGGVGGFIAGLIANAITVNEESIEETIAKLKIPSYLINIFDFKKKYDISKMIKC